MAGAGSGPVALAAEEDARELRGSLGEWRLPGWDSEFYPKHDGARAGGREGHPAEGAHRAAGQARRPLRRNRPDHRLRPLQRAQLGHPPDRGRHPVQGAQPDPSPAARVDVPAQRAQRELRHPAGEPAHLRWMVRGHCRRRLPEPGHPRALPGRAHRRARGRPCLQDGLRPDAGAARPDRRPRHGRLCRGPVPRRPWPSA